MRAERVLPPSAGRRYAEDRAADLVIVDEAYTAAYLRDDAGPGGRTVLFELGGSVAGPKLVINGSSAAAGP